MPKVRRWLETKLGRDYMTVICLWGFTCLGLPALILWGFSSSGGCA